MLTKSLTFTIKSKKLKSIPESYTLRDRKGVIEECEVLNKKQVGGDVLVTVAYDKLNAHHMLHLGFAIEGYMRNE